MSDELFSTADVRLIHDDADFVGLREQWDELYRVSSTMSAPLQFDWLWEWWRVYGPVYGLGNRSLCVVTVWIDGQLVGALPLYRRVLGRYLRHARLQFLSTGEAEFEETCPEYLDVLARPGHEEMVLAKVQAALHAPTAPRWDDIVFLDISKDSTLTSAWSGSVAHGCSVNSAPRGGAWIADLRGGFEAYLSRLSANSRQQARRTLREAERSGMKLELSSARTEVDACFDDLVKLHQSRWKLVGKTGCFSSARFTDFHRALARELVPKSGAILARLRVGGQTLAVIYGFLVGDKFDYYQSGIARIDGNERSGITAHLLLMSRLAEKGVSRYDFLGGDARYKQSLSTTMQPLIRLRIVRPTVRSALWASAMRGRRLMQKCLAAFHRIVTRSGGIAVGIVANPAASLLLGSAI